MSLQDVATLVSYQRAFTITTGLKTISNNAETDFLLLKNPSASPVKLLVTHFLIGTDSNSVRSIFRVYRDPTLTSDGTTLTPVSTYIGDEANIPAAETFYAPTCTDRGVILNMAIGAADSNSRGVNRFYWIEPNHSILVTVENSISNADSFADIYWIEGA